MSTSAGNRRIIFTADARFAVAEPEGKRVLSGYAILWNVTSTDRGGYKVRLKPQSARPAKQVLGLYHHSMNNVLGNTDNATLRIALDNVGVRFDMDLPDTTFARDRFIEVRDKYVRGMSFAMSSAPDGSSVTENGETIFEATDFEFDEISITPRGSFETAYVDVKPPAEPAGNYAARRRARQQLERFKLDSLQWPIATAR